MAQYGAVSCGHDLTAAAAVRILMEGGNAFDAAIAAHFMACVAEPVLASLGGGGFLMAQTRQQTILYDFFAQTPIKAKPASQLDFKPIQADFGTTTQEFHIGMGSVATPGTVKGLFTIHQELGSLPMKELIQPAVEAARSGIKINAFQSYIFSVVKPILFNHPLCRHIYENPQQSGEVLQDEQLFKNPELALTLEQLATEGERCFYQGDIAEAIIDACESNGGLLSADDLQQYRVLKRAPLQLRYRNAQVYINPPPSCGGLLLGFALKLLQEYSIYKWKTDDLEYLQLLALVMNLTNEARLEAHFDEKTSNLDKLLDQEFLQIYQKQLKGKWRSINGTTHLNIMDNKDNIASLTVSNGEGCGYLLAKTGFMLNNMLGEEDLNPGGFFQWPNNHRLISMMAPALVNINDATVALGSGGSNRIRTALLQVLINLVDFGMDLKSAIDQPRIHYEKDCLNLEPGFNPEYITHLQHSFSNTKIWDQKNLYFGGVHALSRKQQTYCGSGDPRRGGVSKLVTKIKHSTILRKKH